MLCVFTWPKESQLAWSHYDFCKSSDPAFKGPEGFARHLSNLTVWLPPWVWLDRRFWLSWTKSGHESLSNSPCYFPNLIWKNGWLHRMFSIYIFLGRSKVWEFLTWTCARDLRNASAARLATLAAWASTDSDSGSFAPSIFEWSKALMTPVPSNRFFSIWVSVRPAHRQ